jgi:hypothetical protein
MISMPNVGQLGFQTQVQAPLNDFNRRAHNEWLPLIDEKVA